MTPVEVSVEQTKDDRQLYTSPSGARMITTGVPADAVWYEDEDGSLIYRLPE